MYGVQEAGLRAKSVTLRKSWVPEPDIQHEDLHPRTWVSMSVHGYVMCQAPRVFFLAGKETISFSHAPKIDQPHSGKTRKNPILDLILTAGIHVEQASLMSTKLVLANLW